MEIISPPTYVFDCKCHCGTHFIATDNDIIKKSRRIIDKMWNPNYVTGDNTAYQNISIIECPFCKAFKIINPCVLDKPKLYQEMLQKHPEEIFQNNDFDFYKELDSELSKLLEVEVKKWTDIPMMREKYKDGLGLEPLND